MMISRLHSPFPFRLMAITCLSSCILACAGPVTVTDPQLTEAIRWYTGEAGRVDEPRAKSLLEQASVDGDAISRMWLARVYAAGRMGYTPEYNLAQAIAETVITDIQRLSELGEPEAAFLLGSAYAEGLGKDIDDAASAHWYRIAAEKGHLLAQQELGTLYAAGRGVEQNDEMAVYWWRQAAEAGGAIAQYQLGLMYQTGRGVSTDLQAARNWFEKAAGRGEPRALEALTLLED